MHNICRYLKVFLITNKTEVKYTINRIYNFIIFNKIYKGTTCRGSYHNFNSFFLSIQIGLLGH